MRICIALLLLCVSAGADDGFKWVVTDRPAFQWSISTTEGGGQPSESIVVEQDAPSTDSGVIDPEVVAPESSNPALAPTSHEAIQFALSMYRGMRPEHTFVDIGCGDGRVLIAAVRKWGCRGVGYEIDPEQAALARACIEAAGLSDKITVIEQDVTDLYTIEGDAGYAFLYPETLAKLAHIIKRIPAFVSYQHPVTGLKETSSEHGNFYSKEPIQAETRVVTARPYAVWNGATYYQEYRPGCQCTMCRSIRAQLSIPRTTTVVVQPEVYKEERSSTVTTPIIAPQPQRRGHFQRQCINGVCQMVWVWDE